MHHGVHQYPGATLHAEEDELHLAILITSSTTTVSASNYCNCALSSVSEKELLDYVEVLKKVQA